MSTTSPTTDMRNFLAGLPTELYQDIADRVMLPKPMWAVISPSKDPSIAPRDGSSPFLALPCEMRRCIFSHLLPPKGRIVEPCQPSTDPEANTPTFITTLQPIKTPKAALRVGDALVLCKKIASEILVTLYEERTFAINVYEGILDGGVEFLNSGRQRIQYREHFTQVRFKRFEGPDDPYGFSRIKRLSIRIHPAKEEGATEQRANNRHNAMHTHFMLRALVKLFQKDAKFGLNFLHIRFIEPRGDGRPHPWQNSSNSSPRSSSIHGLSNVEVIMRALLELRRVQTAVCRLPNGLNTTLGEFIRHFQGVVTGKLELNAMDEHVAMKIEGARDMLDNWVHSIMFPANGDISADLEDIWHD